MTKRIKLNFNVKERLTLEVARKVASDKELVDAFIDTARQENKPDVNLSDGRRRLHLHRDPTPILAPTQFKRGQSGNPAGRPKKVSTAVTIRLSEIELETGLTYAELIAMALVDRACRGDVAAAKAVLEFSEGLATQKIELSGTMDMNVVLNASDEELKEIIDAYLKKCRTEERRKDEKSKFNMG